MVLHERHYAKAEKEFRTGVETARGQVVDWSVSWEVIRGVAGLGRTAGTTVAGIATRVGAKAFEREWKWARLVLPLQVRLAAEQGLWDLGGDYRRLVSGFKPLTGAEDGVSEEETKARQFVRIQRFARRNKLFKRQQFRRRGGG